MAKKFLISDIHFGCRNSSVEWLDMQKDYFYNFLIPKFSKDDYLFILGDIFDNRTAINILVLNETIKIFKDLSSIVKEIHVIVGNHDMYLKNSNDVNSLEIFKDIDNVYLYKDTTLIEIDNINYLFVPFFEDKKLEIQSIKEYQDKNTICLMHSEINGFYYTKSILVNDKNDITIFNKFKKVYSGHFHIRQSKANIIYIGSPFHLDKNDVGNKKGIYYLENNEEYFIENNYSPEFLKINYDEISELNTDQINKITKNNYVDIIIDEDKLNGNINEIVEKIDSKDVKLIVNSKDEENNDVVITENDKGNILKIIKEYIFKIFSDQSYSQKLYNYIEDKYKKMNNL
jgi:DNA repair exonuclease SbcCD nuclease subunit